MQDAGIWTAIKFDCWLFLAMKVAWILLKSGGAARVGEAGSGEFVFFVDDVKEDKWIFEFVFFVFMFVNGGLFSDVGQVFFAEKRWNNWVVFWFLGHFRDFLLSLLLFLLSKHVFVCCVGLCVLWSIEDPVLLGQAWQFLDAFFFTLVII